MVRSLPSPVRFAILVIVLLGACTAGRTGQSPRDRPAPSFATALPPLTSQPFAPGQPCPTVWPDPRLPARAGCVTVAHGDLDGDARSDTVMVFARLDAAGQPRDWQVRIIRPQRGQVLTLQTAPLHPTGQVRVAGLLDLEGNGAREVLVTVGGGAASIMYRVVTLVHGTPTVVRTVGGEELLLTVSSSAGYVATFACEDRDGDGRRELAVVTASTVSDGHGWEWSRTVYRLRGGEVERIGREQGHLDAAPEEPSRVEAVAGNLCDLNHRSGQPSS